MALLFICLVKRIEILNIWSKYFTPFPTHSTSYVEHQHVAKIQCILDSLMEGRA